MQGLIGMNSNRMVTVRRLHCFGLGQEALRRLLTFLKSLVFYTDKPCMCVCAYVHAASLPPNTVPLAEAQERDPPLFGNLDP